MMSLDVFRNRDAARIFAGQALSQVCDKMTTVGLVWVIASLGSARLIPWFLAAGALPHLLFSKPAARWIEKLGALRAVISADLARGVIYLLAWQLWAAWPKMALLFALTVPANCAAALFNPAILSLPGLLPGAKEGLLSRLTAMIDSCFSLGAILGPAAAALLYPWLGLGGLFLLNALGYFLSAFLESRVSLAKTGSAGVGPESLASNGAPPRPALGKDALLRFLLGAFFLMNLAFTPILAFLPLFAKYRFAGGIGVLSGMEMSLGLGMACGGLALSVLHVQGKTGPRIIAGLFSVSLAYLFFSLTRDALAAYAALLLLGLSLSFLNVTILSFFQTRPRESDVPKVMSLVNLISVGAIPISMAMAGALIGSMNLGALALACACVLLTLASLTALHPGVRSA